MKSEGSFEMKKIKAEQLLERSKEKSLREQQAPCDTAIYLTRLAELIRFFSETPSQKLINKSLQQSSLRREGQLRRQKSRCLSLNKAPSKIK